MTALIVQPISQIACFISYLTYFYAHNQTSAMACRRGENSADERKSPKEKMKKPKNKKNLQDEQQWVEGSVQDFLELSDADMQLIETRLAASHLLKATRIRKKITQQAVAEKLQTSQSRVAKMEAGDSSVSLDLLFRSLFALGVSRKGIAAIF